ncbi:MAG: hypothetical protein R2883_06075 [Caldisericia bacterium]
MEELNPLSQLGLDVISEDSMYNEKVFYEVALIKSELTRNGQIYTNLWKRFREENMWQKNKKRNKCG